MDCSTKQKMLIVVKGKIVNYFTLDSNTLKIDAKLFVTNLAKINTNKITCRDKLVVYIDNDSYFYYVNDENNHDIHKL